MKRITLLTVIVALGLASIHFATAADTPTTAPSTAPTTKPSDKEQLQGTWNVVKRVKDGAEEPVKDGDAQLTFAGEQVYSVRDTKNNGEGRFVLDEKKDPKQITMTATAGPYVGQKFSAIYELDGDTLKLAYSTGDNHETAPVDLKGGENEAMEVLKRQKP